MFLLSPVQCDDERDEVTLNRPKITKASASSMGSAGWDSSDSPWISPLRFHSLQVDPASEWVLGIRSLFLTILLFQLRMGKPNSPSFWLISTSFALISSQGKYSMQLSEYLLSKFTPQSARILDRFQVVLSCQIDKFSSDLSVKTDDIQPLLQKRIIGPMNGSPNRLSYGVFPSAKRSWTTSQIAIAFQGVRPPPFIQ